MSDLPPSVSQAYFTCAYCKQAIFIPTDLPPTTAPCPHCGEKVTSPELTKPELLPPARMELTSPIRRDTRLNKDRAKYAEAVASNLVESSSSGSSKVVLFVIMVAAALLALTAALFFWWQNSPKKDDGKLPSVPKSSSSEAVKVEKKELVQTDPVPLFEWKKETSQVLKSFFSAESPKEMMGYVINNPDVGNQISSYYPDGFKNNHLSHDFFTHSDSDKSNVERGIYRMLFKQVAKPKQIDNFSSIHSSKKQEKETSRLLEKVGDVGIARETEPVTINAFFKKTPKGMKLDASVFIQNQFRTFKKFVTEAKPGEAEIFRLLISETLLHEEKDSDEIRTYRLQEIAYPKDYVNISLREDSDVGGILSQINWRGLGKKRIWKTVTLELEWTDESDPQLQIKKIICWEFLGLGGEEGNLKLKKSDLSN